MTRAGRPHRPLPLGRPLPPLGGPSIRPSIMYTGAMAGGRMMFIGDIVGEPGRKAVKRLLPILRDRYAVDFVVANGENAAGGLGITERTATALLDAGVDVITTGNHVFRHREVYRFLDSEPRIVRPSNYLESNPGRGYTVIEKDGRRWAVVNLSGTVFLDAARSPFHEADRVLALLRDKADQVVVDLHAEVTSEKVAMGWHLDGRALAVIGTHTHVPTADARVLPKGTAYITDAGMTGARGGVIGVQKEQILERFLTQLPVKFETATEDVWLMGCVVEATDQGLAQSIEQVLEPAE
jgi:metallophosphoesterase (TIGR00282 family)